MRHASARIRLIEPVMCQPVALPKDIVDFMQFPLPPPRRQAGAHGGHAGGFAGFQRGVAFGVITDEAASLRRDGVEGAEKRIEALAEVGGVERWFFRGEYGD